MTCKFDIYGNGKCYHAKQEPFGRPCEPKGCKLKNDKYPRKNKAYDNWNTYGGLTCTLEREEES